ncbi:Dual-specificity kinase, spindle pole body (SPB) duplication and spindle checkpoint function, partial [Dimargaris xerosporica]
NSENGDPESTLTMPIPAELLDVMKSCLQRDSRQRPTIPELLGHPFLRQTAVAGNGKVPQTQYPPLTPDTLNFVVRQVLQFVHHNPSILQHNSGALDRDVAAITQALLRSMTKP